MSVCIAVPHRLPREPLRPLALSAVRAHSRLDLPPVHLRHDVVAVRRAPRSCSAHASASSYCPRCRARRREISAAGREPAALALPLEHAASLLSAVPPRRLQVAGAQLDVTAARRWCSVARQVEDRPRSSLRGACSRSAMHCPPRTGRDVPARRREHRMDADLVDRPGVLGSCVLDPGDALLDRRAARTRSRSPTCAVYWFAAASSPDASRVTAARLKRHPALRRGRDA